jgi:N-methylhydantoinase A/oxoprolinase/acetone carboxylase beta subunit
MAAVSADGSTVCVLILRLNSSCSRSIALVTGMKMAVPHAPPESHGDGKPSTTRRIWLAGGWREVAVWKRDQIPLGGTVAGPAVIEEAYTTVLLLEGWDCHRDKSGHLIARRA